MSTTVETVFAIYYHGKVHGDAAGNLAYHIVQLFDENGAIDRDILHKMNRDTLLGKDERLNGRFIGPFSDTLSLQKYVMGVGETLRADKICLISSEDYNAALEGVAHLSGLLPALMARGQCLANENKNKNRGILGKLFDL